MSDTYRERGVVQIQENTSTERSQILKNSKGASRPFACFVIMRFTETLTHLFFDLLESKNCITSVVPIRP